jgi:pimeloyl-ACP methyl ester carboxylesterase
MVLVGVPGRLVCVDAVVTLTPGGMPMTGLEQPTSLAVLPDGQVEYRLDRRGETVVLIFHGGHMRAGLASGEDVFFAAGCTVLVPSRPGYRSTPASAGGSLEDYAGLVRELCAELGITRVSVVVGISGGGPTAATMAARNAGFVQRLILISAVGWLPWPDRWMRLGSYVAFATWIEPVTWTGNTCVGTGGAGFLLRLMLASLSTRPWREVVVGLRAEDRRGPTGVRRHAVLAWIPHRSAFHARCHLQDQPTHAGDRQPPTAESHSPPRLNRSPRTSGGLGSSRVMRTAISFGSALIGPASPNRSGSS